MAFFDCFNIVNLDLNRSSRMGDKDVSNSLVAYDFGLASDDESFKQVINYLRQTHNSKVSKYGKRINFGVKDLSGATKYNVYDLINEKPQYIALTGAYSNHIAGGFKEDGAITSFGKYIIKLIEKNKIPIDVSELSERCFYELMQSATRPLIATHSCLNQNSKKLPYLKDYQTKMLVEQEGMVCFLLEGKKTLRQTAEEINKFVEMYGTKNIGLGSGQKNIRQTGYYVAEIKNILHKKGYPLAALDDIFINNSKRFFKL